MTREGSRADRAPRAYGPVEMQPVPVRAGEDAVDRHVRRWSRWEDLAVDPDIEAVVTRIQHLDRYLRETTRAAVAAAGLEHHDYETLHALLIRDTPGYATTGELATSSHVSPATMTGRVDRLLRLGLVRRVRSDDDRRVVRVQVTDEGFRRWRHAMDLRGAAEAALFVEIPRAGIRQLAGRLRGLLLAAERRHDELRH